jgi:MFS family permease
MFHVGRVVCGLGIGILVTVCPMYLSELSSPHVRGWLVGHHAIFLVFGYMLSAWLGFACYFATATNESFAWRFPLCMQCLPPTVLFSASFWIPRSPRWLLSKGKSGEAWTVLQKLRSTPSDPDDIAAKEEYYQTREQLRLDNEKLAATGHSVWTAVWKKKSYRKRMIVGFMTQWGAEFAGPLVIVSVPPPLIVPSISHKKLLIKTEQLCCHLIHEPRHDWIHATAPGRTMAHDRW